MIVGTKLEEKNIVWSTKPRGDKVFFDHKHKLLVFLRDSILEFLPFFPTDFPLPSTLTIPEPDNRNKDFGNTLEGIETKSIGFSLSLKNFVISRKPHLLEFMDPLSLGRSVPHKLPQASSLILFDWLRKNKTGNFFYVSTGGIQVLLIDEQTLSNKKAQSISAPILNAWFDWTKQFLAVSFFDTPTELKIFDLNRVDEGLNFKSPIHLLSLGLEPGYSLPAFNTNPYYERTRKTEETNSSVVVDFINLYNESYLLHIDSEMGELTLHEVGGLGSRKVKILSESRFRYNIVDNLLVIHYLLEQLTSIVDVRKDSTTNLLFGAPRAILINLEDIQVTELLHFCNYLDQAQVDLFKVRTAEINKPANLLSTFYSEQTINLDTNLTINTSQKTIIELKVDLSEALKAFESDIERFCFLFRRNKAKDVYVNFLRQLLLSRERISILRPIFNKVLDNYRTAKNEIKALHQKMKLSASGVTIDSYKKLGSGESFLRMREFSEDILAPIRDTFFMTPAGQEFLLQALLCFVNLALEKKLAVEPPVEDAMLRLFIKTKKFLVLHQIVQNSVITDRLNIGIVLCELGSKVKRPLHEDTLVSECLTDMGTCFYPAAFQLGVDMLYRLRSPSAVGISTSGDEQKLTLENLIFTYHVRNLKILECIEMLETKHIKLSIGNLESLLVASNQPESNYSFKKLIMYFSMKQTRERILGSNDKFDEIVNRIIKQNEFMKALTAD